MSFRTHLATAVAALSLASCQSVRTQEATPPPLDRPVDLSLSPAAATSTATPSPTPAAKPSARHSYNSVPGVGRVIAITFDDGPSPKLTPMLLDMLAERKIKATFFVVGQNAAEYPEILERMAAEGHEIGNHSWSHPALTGLGAAGVKSQMEKTNAAIKAATGRDTVVMRPPFGATNAALNKRFAETFGMKVILWSVDPLDWKYRNAARVRSHILANTAPGAIILAHDIHPSTVAAMPGTLDALLAQGYKFATVSELIAMEGKHAAPASASTPAASPKPTNVISVPSPTPEASPTPTPYDVKRYESVSEGSASQ
jgi:peptidoglycan/xylan/chitin deacetylase (PgdA/CDA1 family)